jgi:mRNA-degrading endonuclease HigB of HigAB toxin-antitoxin module
MIKEYKKSFRQGKAYKAYLRNHPNHESELHELIERVSNTEFHS